MSCELSDQGSLQFNGMYTPPDLTWKEPEMRLWNTTVEGDRLLGTFGTAGQTVLSSKET